MSQLRLSSQMQAHIERILQRSVVGEEGNVAWPTDFTPADEQDFRTLHKNSGIFAVRYIKFRLPEGIGLRIVASYLDLVILEGFTVKRWIETLPKNVE